MRVAPSSSLPSTYVRHPVALGSATRPPPRRILGACSGGGLCEERMGRWLRARPIDRDELVLISKGGCEGQEKLWCATIADHPRVKSELERSLRRLGVDYLDLCTRPPTRPSCGGGPSCRRTHAPWRHAVAQALWRWQHSARRDLVECPPVSLTIRGPWPLRAYCAATTHCNHSY